MVSPISNSEFIYIFSNWDLNIRFIEKKQAHFSDWSKSRDILEFGIGEPNRRPQLLIDQQKVLQFRKLVNCNMNTAN